MILVTGATGNVGSNVVRSLGEREVPVRVLGRGDPVERGAFEGVSRVFLCTANHPAQVAHEVSVIDAAVSAGVRRVVKVSANGAEIGSPVAFLDAHGRIEEHLRATGVPSVVLRPTTYMTNLLGSAAAIRATGKLFLPAGDAKVALIDPRDVAAVAVAALVEDGHEARTYLLTGPSPVTFDEVAAELSAATGRPVSYVDVPDEAAVAGMVEAGMPEWFAANLVRTFGELRGGLADLTTDVVRVLTGREPRTFAEFARDHAAAF